MDSSWLGFLVLLAQEEEVEKTPFLPGALLCVGSFLLLLGGGFLLMRLRTRLGTNPEDRIYDTLFEMEVTENDPGRVLTSRTNAAGKTIEVRLKKIPDCTRHALNTELRKVVKDKKQGPVKNWSFKPLDRTRKELLLVLQYEGNGAGQTRQRQIHVVRIGEDQYKAWGTSDQGEDAWPVVKPREIE